MKALRAIFVTLTFHVMAFGQTTMTPGIPTVDQIGKSFFVFLPLVNGGSAALSSVAITSATLGSSLNATSPKLPFSVGNLAVGSFGAIRLLFPDTTLIKGQKYVLTASGTFLENGLSQTFEVTATVTYGLPTIFDHKPNPVTVSPTLDTEHAITQVISATNGGTLTTTGADGSVFNLTFPANALASDEQITMTPLAVVGGLPVSGGLLAGVDLQPDGLPLKQIVRLTIQPNVVVPCSEQVGFGYHGTGQEFYFQPLGMSNTITLSLEHFSAAGVGQGLRGSGGTPTDEEDRLSQAAQAILQQERQCTAAAAPVSQSQLGQQLEGTYQLYFDKVVVPLLQAAKTDDSQAPAAISKAIGLWRQLQLLGFATQEPFTLDIQFIEQSLPTILKNVYNKAYSRCLNDTSQTARMAEASKMIGMARIFELLGYDLTKEFPNFDQQVAACVVGPITLDIDSSATGEDHEATRGVVIDTKSHVTASSFPLNFNANQLSYSASGALTYDSYSVSAVWASGLADCSSGTGNNGTESATATFDLNLPPASPSDVRLEVTLTPSITETTFLGEIHPTVGCQGGSTTSMYYMFDLDASHSDQQQTPSHSYFVNVNTPVTYNLSGTSTYATVTYNATESTTLTVSQSQ